MLLPEAAWMNDVVVHGPGSALGLNEVRVVRAPRVSSEPRPQGHGTLARTRWYSGAVLSMRGWCIGSGSRADAGMQSSWDEFLLATSLDEAPVLFKFRPRGEGALWRYELYEEDPLEDEGGVAPWFLWGGGWVSPRAWAESETLKQETYDPTVVGAGAGLTWPLTWPLDWTAADPLDGLLRATTEGNIAAWPTLLIQGPVIGAGVTNESVGSTIVTTADLGVDDTLLIDTYTRRVLLNGTTERPDLIDPTSGWWNLPVGDNYLRLNGSGMLAGTTTLTATWRDARLF